MHVLLSNQNRRPQAAELPQQFANPLHDDGREPIGEVLRFLHEGPVHAHINSDPKSPEYRNTVQTQQDFSTINPAYERPLCAKLPS